ncbi:Ku protein [Streptomyces sp. NPDC002467]|uniref:Ku protein n=1 Tax=Streptomyces sp. NPDC002467 TaxID=3364647 RepID=UPI0036AF0975
MSASRAELHRLSVHHLAPHLLPQRSKVYSLLEQALAKAGKAGIATFVMRQHEYLVALKAENGLLTLHTLHWADEIRDPPTPRSTPFPAGRRPRPRS